MPKVAIVTTKEWMELHPYTHHSYTDVYYQTLATKLFKQRKEIGKECAMAISAYLEDIGEIHKTEPYVYCQMVAGKDAINPGEGKNSWLTGTAAWTFTVLSQGILGIKPQYDGLLIDPCVPSSFKEYTVNRTFRKARYHITIKNPKGVQKGVKKLIVNGKEIPVGIIPVAKANKDVNIEVIMG